MNFRQQHSLIFGILSQIPWLFRKIPWLLEVSFKFPDFSRFSRLFQVRGNPDKNITPTYHVSVAISSAENYTPDFVKFYFEQLD